MLPEANIAIYPDRILLHSTKRKQNSLSAVETTISVRETEPDEKTIFFKGDLAFKIDERKHKVSLIGIVNEKV
jgi:hypothetical protein